MSLKGQFIDRLITPITQEIEAFITVAKVIKADSKNNICDIEYVDKRGKAKKRENVPLRLMGTGMEWFPVEDDLVDIEIERRSCVIVGRHIDDYNADVRSKMKLTQDCFSDSAGSPPGASIY